jgi:hypothetical protein
MSGPSVAPVPVLPSTEHGPGVPGGWPLRDFIELGALPGAVPCARLHSRQVLWEWQLTSLSDNTELLISELVTNAVAASRSMERGFPVRLWLLSDRVQALILAWDASPRPPVRVDAGDDSESGRGLLLVDAISIRWGWFFPQDNGGGKTVWALTGADPPGAPERRRMPDQTTPHAPITGDAPS